MATISTTITHGVTLSTSGSYASPLTITSAGAVETGSGNAIYGPGGQPWTIINEGLISAGVTAYRAITLKDGGVILNAGTVVSLNTHYHGIKINGGSAYVSNSQTGYLAAVDLYASGKVVNDGRIIDNAHTGVLVRSAGTGTVFNY